ncbi:MAG: hypothetical protein Kow0062_20140 [Acidobacteriota bacterium]
MRPVRSFDPRVRPGAALRDCTGTDAPDPVESDGPAGRCYTRPVISRPRSRPLRARLAVPRIRRLAAWWPLRPSGVVLAIASAGALAEGRRRLDLVLSLAGAWGLVLVALCGLAALLSAAWTRRRLRRALRGARPPLTGVAGERLASGVALRPALLPLIDDPRLRWLEPPARGLRARPGEPRGPEVVVPERRDLAPRIVREVRVGDVLGLWSFRTVVAEARETVVLPGRGRLVEAELAACLAAGDELAHPWGRAVGDRVDARPYVRSDPARMILWKVYARSRELLVRTPEPARAPRTRPLVFLATGEDDEAAAAAARVVWAGGLAGEGARFACDGTPEPLDDVDAGLRAIAASARHRERAGRDLAPSLAAAQGAPDDPVLVILPAFDRRTVGHVLSVAGRSGADRFSVIGAFDSRPPRPPEPRWRRALLRAPAEPGGTPAGLADAAAALAPLAAAGARIVVVDRRTGAVHVVAPGPVAREATRAVAGPA